MTDIFLDHRKTKTPQEIIIPPGSSSPGELFPSSAGKNKKIEKDNGNERAENETPLKSEELIALEARASRAQVLKHIQTDQLNRLKIETEKIQFLKATGKVAEFPVMDTLFLNYLEKMHLDSIRMLKKLKPRIEILVRDPEVSKNIHDLLKKEISNLLKHIKDTQKKEVEQWKTEF